MDWNRIVYKMTSKTNGRYYIGKCVILDEYKYNPLVQIMNHYKSALNKNNLTPFYKSINDIGLENFKFEILDYCNYDENYDKKNIFKKYLSNETNPNLLLYQEQRIYVENILNK